MDMESQSGAMLSINLDSVTLAALTKLATEKQETVEVLLLSLIKRAIEPRPSPRLSLEGAEAAGRASIGMKIDSDECPSSHPARWTVIDTWMTDETSSEELIQPRPSFSELQLRLRFAGTPALDTSSR